MPDEYKPDKKFLDYLRDIKNPDKKTFYLAGRYYSAKELISEVEKRTDIGKKLNQLHNELQERLLKKDKKPEKKSLLSRILNFGKA